MIGPYADSLNHVLDLLEGHYLIGFGDRSARTEELRPIHLVVGTTEAVSAWLGSHGAPSSDAVTRLIELVDGFAAPYRLELLATVPYAARATPATSEIDELIRRVQAWNGRKARLFTYDHIRAAHRRLQTADLLPSPVSTS